MIAAMRAATMGVAVLALALTARGGPATAPATRAALTKPAEKKLRYVRMAPEAVRHKTLHAGEKDEPKIGHGEEGVCIDAMEMGVDFRAHGLPVQRDGEEWVVRARPEIVAMNVKVTITVWLPKDPPGWLTDHEEAHRQIAQSSIHEAAALLDEDLTKLAAQVFEVRDKSSAAGQQLIIKKISDTLTAAYSKRFPEHTQKLQKRFDEITQHGRLASPTADEARLKVLQEGAAQ